MAGLVGQSLGGCVLVRLIGHGGVGEVYLADQSELDRQVAVKVSRLEAAPTADSAALASAQFTQEARLIASLEHPNILPIYDVGKQDGLHYLIMPYVRDGSLADLVAPGPTHRLDLPLPPAVVMGLVAQAAAGLRVAHDHQPRVVHGDVKPANLLAQLLPVDPATGMPANVAPASAPAASARVRVLLADFGLASTASDPNQPRQVASASSYTAPEQFSGPALPESDQYALACVAYELLTGQPVFVGEPAALYQQHVFASPPPPQQRNPLLPPAVDQVLLRALAKDPAQRYGRVDEFVQALGAVLGAALAPSGQMAGPGAMGGSWSLSRPIAGTTLPASGAGPFPPPMAPPPPAPDAAYSPSGPMQTVASPPALPPVFPPMADPPGAALGTSGPMQTLPPSPTAPPSPPAPVSNKRVSRRGLLIAGGSIAGAAVLAAGGAYWFSRTHPNKQIAGTTSTPGATTTPVAAKHPGDTLGLYRPATGTFVLQQTLAENSAIISLVFGKPGLLPITGDWDGDGVDTLGVYDPATLTFMLADQNEKGASITHRFQFGQPGDLPLAGDWAGTGRDGVGIFRPATGQFILTNSLSGGAADFVMQLGQVHDLPVIGDWNGDGHDSIGVFRPSTQTFYLSNSACNCVPVISYTVDFGQRTGQPVAGDWTHTGRSGLGMFDPASSTMLLKNDATTSGPPDQNILFGTSGDIPLAGHWGLGS